MHYIEQHLITGERLIYKTRLHRRVFFWVPVWLLFALMGFAGDSTSMGWVFLLLGLVAFVLAYIAYTSAEFGVTNKRVLIKTGFMGRRSLEILLAKVEGIGVDQGILARILGYGTIQIIGTGGSKETFYKIDKPFEFRKQVQEQIASVQDVSKQPVR